VPRTGGYAYAVGVWEMSIVQGPFSVAPCHTLALRFANFCIAVGAAAAGRRDGNAARRGHARAAQLERHAAVRCVFKQVTGEPKGRGNTEGASAASSKGRLAGAGLVVHGGTKSRRLARYTRHPLTRALMFCQARTLFRSGFPPNVHLSVTGSARVCECVCVHLCACR
jgi:hypothetical protein